MAKSMKGAEMPQERFEEKVKVTHLYVARNTAQRWAIQKHWMSVHGL